MIGRIAGVVALLACLLAQPAPAAADHGVPVLDDELADYMGVALAFWGGPAPSCVLDGRTIVPVHAVLFDDPAPEVAATADQPGCRLWLDTDYWGHQTRAEACTLIVHEWGHLLGHPHSDDAASIMAETPTYTPRGCQNFDRSSKRVGPRACGARSLRSARVLGSVGSLAGSGCALRPRRGRPGGERRRAGPWR